MEKRQLKAYSMFYLEEKEKGPVPSSFSPAEQLSYFLTAPARIDFKCSMCVGLELLFQYLGWPTAMNFFPGESSPQTFKHHKCCITDIPQHVQSGKGFTFTKKNTFRKYLHVCAYICLHVHQTHNIRKSIRVICTKFLNDWYAFCVVCAGALYP